VWFIKEGVALTKTMMAPLAISSSYATGSYRTRELCKVLITCKIPAILQVLQAVT
jgi:hypothetical protein